MQPFQKTHSNAYHTLEDFDKTQKNFLHSFPLETICQQVLDFSPNFANTRNLVGSVLTGLQLDCI